MASMNLNITPLQWIGIVLIVNGAITGSVNEMTDLVGAVWAHHAVSIATIGSGICGGLVTMFGGQGSQVRNVLAMPGVENMKVNAQANPTLAAIAVDPSQTKIAPTPEAKAIVTELAKGS
jgi:hypothetical protein